MLQCMALLVLWQEVDRRVALQGALSQGIDEVNALLGPGRQSVSRQVSDSHCGKEPSSAPYPSLRRPSKMHRARKSWVLLLVEQAGQYCHDKQREYDKRWSLQRPQPHEAAYRRRCRPGIRGQQIQLSILARDAGGGAGAGQA
jgi:hypothetical protein